MSLLFIYPFIYSFIYLFIYLFIYQLINWRRYYIMGAGYSMFLRFGEEGLPVVFFF